MVTTISATSTIKVNENEAILNPTKSMKYPPKKQSTMFGMPGIEKSKEYVYSVTPSLLRISSLIRLGIL